MMARSTLMRAVVPLAMVVTAVTAATTVTSPPALAKARHKPETLEHALVHWVNVQRQHKGLPALSPAADLTAAAHRHTAQMAKTGHVAHNPTLGKEVHGWLSLGEDVGSAATLHDLEQAFLADAHDRANLLGPGFRHIGVGTKVRNGLLYVTVVTRRPAVASPG
jgi:uncharacterized protein YkwD